MKQRLWAVLLVFCVSVFSISGLAGCAQTINAIDNAKMQTWVKMSDTIFLDPVGLSKNRNVYIRTTNTSDMQEIAFDQFLREDIAKKGYTVVSDPTQAGFIIQSNILYMDNEKKSLTADGLLAGGFGGVLAGAGLGNNSGSAIVGGILGAVGGALVGSAFHVDTYLGAVDVQIQEKVPGGVTGTMVTNAQQGSATTLKTQQEVKSDYQTYRTRIVAKARQTNIDKKEAAGVLSDKLATQIAGMF